MKFALKDRHSATGEEIAVQCHTVLYRWRDEKFLHPMALGAFSGLGGNARFLPPRRTKLHSTRVASGGQIFLDAGVLPWPYGLRIAFLALDACVLEMCAIAIQLRAKRSRTALQDRSAANKIANKRLIVTRWQ